MPNTVEIICESHLRVLVYVQDSKSVNEDGALEGSSLCRQRGCFFFLTVCIFINLICCEVLKHIEMCGDASWQLNKISVRASKLMPKCTDTKYNCIWFPQFANNAQLFIFFFLVPFGGIGFMIRQSSFSTAGKSLQATRTRFVGKLLHVVPIKMMNCNICLCK